MRGELCSAKDDRHTYNNKEDGDKEFDDRMQNPLSGVVV
jgi:hypothetical protein